MTYDVASQSALDFARRAKSRILGNDDDQRICADQPSQYYDFGTLFTRTVAEINRKGDRSRFKPNSMSVRFEVAASTLANLSLELRPSFWLYFRRGKGEQPPAEWGDKFDPDSIWMYWKLRLSKPPDAYPPKADDDDEGERPFVRKRYTMVITGKPDELAGRDLDLEAFWHDYQWLGDSKSAPWQGRISVQVHPGSTPDRRLIEVTLSNETTHAKRGGPKYERTWFDVRLFIKVSCPILPIYCPLLDREFPGVYAQTTNCVVQSRSQENENPAWLIAEQIGEVIRHRQLMRDALTFSASRSLQALFASAEAIAADAAGLDSEHAAQLRSAIARLKDQAQARQALEIVAETFARSMPANWSWRRHQIAILLLGAVGYLDQRASLAPLVVNVPTAGGKTEAFTALALWTVAFEALQPEARIGMSILKYPTTMLSDDQAGRLARYVMAFDTVMAERIPGHKPRGLGLFFGSDSEDVDPQNRIGKTCPWPDCEAPWQKVEKLPYHTGQRLTCAKGHALVVATHDEVFSLRPALIVSTQHKFVAKSKKGLMAQLLGAAGYWCKHNQEFTHRKHCWVNNQKENHDLAKQRTLITLVVLDEAHLVREASGALASHFETHYLELAKLLGGRYPHTLVSTATIAQVRNHIRQLGLGGKPTIFPSEDGQGAELAYYERTDQINHVILACMPRGRAIAWAMPHLVGDYMDVLEKNKQFSPFAPTMVYCPSYLTRDQVRDGIIRHVNQLRQNETPPRSALKMDEFSRQRFNQEGQDAVLARLKGNEVQVILSTNIASVGVDLGELRSILFFGVPSNVSEFIQSLNRVARRPGEPGIAMLVLDPYKERDNSYYAFLEPFALYPHRIVEAIPLNRFARKAIEETFDTIAMGLISHFWAPRITNLDIRRPQQFRAARGLRLKDNEASELLKQIFRADDDLSGAYPGRVDDRWTALATNISGYQPKGRKGADFPYGDDWIWYAGGLKNLWNLIPDQPQGEIALTPEALALQRGSIGVVYGQDTTEVATLDDEEFGLVSGASEDKDLGLEEAK